jgi:hypothetical protein
MNSRCHEWNCSGFFGASTATENPVELRSRGNPVSAAIQDLFFSTRDSDRGHRDRSHHGLIVENADCVGPGLKAQRIE